MRTYRWLLFGLLMLLGGVVHAEGNCPPGYYPIGAPPGQGGPQGCAPIPGDNNNQQQAQPQPPPPPPQWASQWGAIATDGPGGHLGVATNLSSKSEAEQVAMADCQAKGGTNCKIETWYSNGCAAMVVGDSGHNSNNAATLDEATQLGMKTCSASDTNCHVYYSACSLPVRIQ
jgi:hypothetical protein